MREALIFLFAAVIFVPLAARFGLGSVLGYIIAGAAIGPWGLGLIRDVTATHTLAELYPDFDIDGDAERAALARARLVVWLHPFYWYGVPALMKHWFDQVLKLTPDI